MSIIRLLDAIGIATIIASLAFLLFTLILLTMSALPGV